MLKITIPDTEFFNDEDQTFVTIKGQEIALEHSLVSISKWEAKWNIPFLDSSKQRTVEQTIDYIRCMTLTQNVNPLLYYALTKENYEEIYKYMTLPMTATWFSEDKNGKRPSKEIITSEIIYYWMIAQNIPMECQKWHLNRLITLIRVCSIKNTPPKKMGKRDMISRRNALNQMRRSKR